MNMDETTQEEPVNAVEDNAERVQSKTMATLDRADEIAERQKRENDRREELIQREEALAARKAVGGELEAGQETKKVEETPKEYAERVMSGNVVK